MNRVLGREKGLEWSRPSSVFPPSVAVVVSIVMMASELLGSRTRFDRKKDEASG
jgi:hypothetical protein